MKIFGNLDPHDARMARQLVQRQETAEAQESERRVAEARIAEKLFLNALRLTDSDMPFPIPPRRSTGFGGKNKDRRIQPEQFMDVPPHPMQEQLERLEIVRARIEAEIEDARRDFYRWEMKLGWDGNIDERKRIIYDDKVKEAIRVPERAALATAIGAVRIGVYEADSRMKGFPGIARAASDPEAYGNINHLRAPYSDHLADPLLQAMLSDVEERFSMPLFSSKPNYYGEYEAYEPVANWQSYYDTDHSVMADFRATASPWAY